MAEEDGLGQEDNLTLKDGEALSLAMTQVLSLVGSQMQRAEEQKQRIDAQEQMLAQLLMGYSELTVLVQGLAAKTMADMGEEDSKQFLATLDAFRMDMTQAIRDAARGEEGNYAGFASALSRLGGFRDQGNSDQQSTDAGADNTKSP